MRLFLVLLIIWVPKIGCGQSQDTNREDQKGNSIVAGHLSGEEIIHTFLENMDSNYPHVPLVHKIRLKENESIKNGNKLYSNEALIEYMREGYLTYDSDLMKLINGKNEIHTDTLFDDHLYGGLAEIKKDLIKYPREFMEVKRGLYQYNLVDILEEDVTLYKVEFAPLSKKSKYHGYFYFSSTDFALIKTEYSFSEYGIVLLNKLHAGMSFEWKKIEETVLYEKHANPKKYLDDHDRYFLSKIETRGVGTHKDWQEELEVVTELEVLETNRTTFFANEYYRIDDNAALAQINYSKDALGSKNDSHVGITHAEIIQLESKMAEKGNFEIEENLPQK